MSIWLTYYNNKNTHKQDSETETDMSSRYKKLNIAKWQVGRQKSVAPKRISPEAIAFSIKAFLSRQNELSESTTDNITD